MADKPELDPRPISRNTTLQCRVLCKEEITSSGRLVAALLFKNVLGSKAERFLNGFIALSALGNALSVVCLFHGFCRNNA